MLRDNFRTVIDGYNLIFQCGLEGRSRNPLAIERARKRLISTLRNRLSVKDRKQIAIIFDAQSLPIKEDDTVSIQEAMTIVYALEYDDADSMIEEIIRNHSAPKQLTIVSSDHRIQKAALRRKASPIDSDVWFDQVEQTAVPAANANVDQAATAQPESEKDLPDAFGDIDWAKEFGVDED